MVKDDLMRWLAFGLIALAVLIFYFPSLYFPPRADQVIYLSETSGLGQRPWDLIVGCYDHNRHRTIAPGDELLFRPLLYAMLGTEQVVLGHHFWVWQLIGLAGHLILIWFLLRLLWHLSGGWFAFAGTWLFALSIFNYELVTWPHLSSYLLMMACMVGAIEQMVFCFEENGVSRARVARMLVYFFIACFIYETANIWALFITGLLVISFPKTRARLFILALPVILYAFLSYFNYVYVDHVSHGPVTGIMKGMVFGRSVLAFFYLSFWWLYEGLFNGLYHYMLGIRTMFFPNEVMRFKPLIFNDPQVVLQFMILAAFIGLAWIGRRSFKNFKFLIVLLALLASYVAVIVIGRRQEMGTLWAAVGVNSYFLYMYWVIVVIMAFLLLKVKEATRLKQGLMVVFIAASLLSGLWQGKRIYGMCLHYSNATNNTVLLVTTLDYLIQEKESEPNFSFYVDPEYPGNYPYGSIRKVTDPLQKEYSFAEFLYPQYFRPRAEARYKFLAAKKR